MVLLTSPGHYSRHYTMNVRCMEYVKNNMNTDLTMEVYTQPLTSEAAPYTVYQRSALICHMILLKQQC